MKIRKIFFLASLLLATVALQAQDGETTSDWQPPQPAKWLTMSSAGLTMGFAEGWETHEDATAMVGVSPDGKVRISAIISQFHTVEETVANLQREFSSWCDGLTLTDPQDNREVNGLTLLYTGGTAKLQGEETPIDVAIDILETPVDGDNAIVVIATYGFHEGMMEHFDDILMALKSFKRSE
ncbi:MAG: hypothetical protein IPM82_22380 [Saprospiraceae bacterium]|nr:hypothetical protein [Saprospiraceae bacterium]